MGDLLSKPSLSNPSSTISTSAMSSPNSPQTHQSKAETELTQQSKDPEPEALVPESSDPSADTNPQETKENTVEGNGDGEGEEEEEEGECGFCLFMKGGGCKDTFVDWEKCVEEGEKNGEDIVEKCFQATAALRKCMDAHSDYYAPLLEAEKAAQEEAERQLEEGKEEISDGSEKKEESLTWKGF